MQNEKGSRRRIILSIHAILFILSHDRRHPVDPVRKCRRARFYFNSKRFGSIAGLAVNFMYL